MCSTHLFSRAVWYLVSEGHASTEGLAAQVTAVPQQSTEDNQMWAPWEAQEQAPNPAAGWDNPGAAAPTPQQQQQQQPAAGWGAPSDLAPAPPQQQQPAAAWYAAQYHQSAQEQLSWGATHDTTATGPPHAASWDPTPQPQQHHQQQEVTRLLGFNCAMFHCSQNTMRRCHSWESPWPGTGTASVHTRHIISVRAVPLLHVYRLAVWYGSQATRISSRPAATRRRQQMCSRSSRPTVSRPPTAGVRPTRYCLCCSGGLEFKLHRLSCVTHRLLQCAAHG